jgi:polo-like kinase 1
LVCRGRQITEQQIISSAFSRIQTLTLLSSFVPFDQMSQEITIHRELKHKHIVGFHDYFEDKNHIFIILEICNKRVS